MTPNGRARSVIAEWKSNGRVIGSDQRGQPIVIQPNTIFLL
jgi:hypothetical protein